MMNQNLRNFAFTEEQQLSRSAALDLNHVLVCTGCQVDRLNSQTFLISIYMVHKGHDQWDNTYATIGIPYIPLSLVVCKTYAKYCVMEHALGNVLSKEKKGKQITIHKFKKNSVFISYTLSVKFCFK